MAVRVNGELIGDGHFHAAFLQLSGGRAPDQVRQASVGTYQRIVQAAEQGLLRTVLLRQAGTAAGLRVTQDEVEAERRVRWGSAANQTCGVGVTQQMEDALLLRKTEQHLTRHVPRPERREVETMYRGNPQAFAMPERWLVSHIVKLAESEEERQDARPVLERASEELRRGKSFAQVADRHSDCRGNGGSLGWINHGDMAPDFELEVVLLERRKPSGIFETVFGLHIALVQDHKPAGVQPLEEVRPELARRLYDERRARVLDSIVHDLYRRATIDVVADAERTVAAGERMLA